jgi:uncharacterized protein (DUF1499 family)
MKKALLIVIIILLLLSTAFIVNLFIKGYQSKNMENKNTFNGQTLGTCPDKPNCVSTFNSKDSKNYITPLEVSKLDFKLKEMDTEGFTVIKSEDNYLYLTHKSTLFGFIDDIEILYSPENKLIHFRSASRVGYSDLGANRKRIEKLKDRLRQL